MVLNARRLRFLLLALSLPGLAVLGACRSSGDAEISGVSATPPNVIYEQADALLDKRSYQDAAAKFEEVDREHPYSPYARRAIVMSAFANYKAGNFPEAISGAKRYVTLHPGTKESALAQHIIASSYYEQIKDPKRDQQRTKRALNALQTLVRRHPDSSYAKKAQNRINITSDILAASEMNVGRYYLKQHNYLASINRFRTVVTQYQTTAHIEEALMRLTEAYMALGIKKEAQTAAAVLGHNFPDSKWYKHSYDLLSSDGLEPREDSGSWISRALKKVRVGRS
ncbi:MAG: outer membrane protein assembly factor BamD [Hyphomicrobiales bacterium]|nr:outer membrane protein assembly factor BamD [Hyphomicrobiales bacterium]